MSVLDSFLGALDELMEQVQPVLAMVGDRRGGVGARGTPVWTCDRCGVAGWARTDDDNAPAIW